MTGAQKFTWGLILNIGGAATLLVGILLTSTICGAIIGVPMILVGLPLLIWGVVWIFQAQSQRAQEAIAFGVQQGIERANQPLGSPSVPIQSAETSSPKETAAAAGAESQAERAPGEVTPKPQEASNQSEN